MLCVPVRGTDGDCRVKPDVGRAGWAPAGRCSLSAYLGPCCSSCRLRFLPRSSQLAPQPWGGISGFEHRGGRWPGSGGAKAICLHSGPAALPSGGIRGKKLLLACCCSFHSGDFSPFISLIHVPFRCAGASPAELGLPTWYPRAPKGPAGGSLLKGGVGFNP